MGTNQENWGNDRCIPKKLAEENTTGTWDVVDGKKKGKTESGLEVKWLPILWRRHETLICCSREMCSNLMLWQQNQYWCILCCSKTYLHSIKLHLITYIRQNIEIFDKQQVNKTWSGHVDLHVTSWQPVMTSSWSTQNMEQLVFQSSSAVCCGRYISWSRQEFKTIQF